MRGRERTAAEQPPAEVGAGVAEERADEHVDHDALPVRQSAQQHRVGEREADPVDPEQRHRHPPDARAALSERQREQHRQRGDRDQQDLELAAVERRGEQAGEREKPARRTGCARSYIA